MGQRATRPIENIPEGTSDLPTAVNEEPDAVIANSNGNNLIGSSINANPGSAAHSLLNHVTNVFSAVSRAARSSISFNSRSAPYSISDRPINTLSAVHFGIRSSPIFNYISNSDSNPAANFTNSFSHTALNSTADSSINSNTAVTHATQSSINSKVATSDDGNTMLSTHLTPSCSLTDINTATDSALTSHSETPININPVIGPVTRLSSNTTSRHAPYSRPDRVTSTENRSTRSSHSNRPRSTNNASFSLPSSSDHTPSRSRSGRSARSSRHHTSTRHTPSRSNAAPSTSSTPTEKIRRSRSGKWLTVTSFDPVSNCTITLRTNAMSTKIPEEFKVHETLYQAISRKRRSGRIAKRKEEKRKIDKLAKEFYERKIKEGISHPDMSECREEAMNYVPTEEELFESIGKFMQEINENGYDSDDSLNSDSDLLTAEEGAEKDKHSKEINDWYEKNKTNLVEQITETRIEEGRDRNREQYLTTLPYREAADEFLARTVTVYNDDTRNLAARGPKGPPPITRGIFHRCLIALENLVPEDQMGRLGILDYKATINKVNNGALTEKFTYFMINTRFLRPPKESAATFIKNKAWRIICSNNIREVLHGPYEFQLTTKDCVEALADYYNYEFETRNNQDSTDLTISIRGFVRACYVVSRRKGEFERNAALNYVVLAEEQ